MEERRSRGSCNRGWAKPGITSLTKMYAADGVWRWSRVRFPAGLGQVILLTAAGNQSFRFITLSCLSGNPIFTELCFT